jgi:hypothetical protein
MRLNREPFAAKAIEASALRSQLGRSSSPRSQRSLTSLAAAALNGLTQADAWTGPGRPASRSSASVAFGTMGTEGSGNSRLN